MSQYRNFRIYTDPIFSAIEFDRLIHVSKLKLPIDVATEPPEAASRIGVVIPSPVGIEPRHKIVLQMVLAPSIVVHKLPTINKKRRMSHDRGE